MHRGIALLCSVFVVAVGGCSSMSSTYVGSAKPGDRFEGMPIVINRPKFLKVTFKTVTVAPFATRTIESGANSTEKRMEQLGEPMDVSEVQTEVLAVGEVYTLDLKRPAAGTTDYSIEFEPNAQYPKKIGAKIDDQTIEKVGSTIGEVLKKVGETFKLASSGDEGAQPKVTLVRLKERIDRIELRSLDEPQKRYVVFPSEPGARDDAGPEHAK